MAYNSGAPDLGNTGCVPSLQTTDIHGNARPGIDFGYSIGAHEMQYSVLTNPDSINTTSGKTDVQSKYE